MAIKKISISNLRKIIREEIGRNYRTLNNDPFTWKDYKDIETSIYANQKGGFDAEVKCEKRPDLNTGIQSFPDEATADHWARMHAERMMRMMLSSK